MLYKFAFEFAMYSRVYSVRVNLLSTGYLLCVFVSQIRSVCILHGCIHLHDVRLDGFLNFDNRLSTADTRTPAVIASDIKDAEDKESDQNGSSD